MRRFAAVWLTLSLGAFQFEALIADVCDGDASPAERAAWVAPASDLATHGSVAAPMPASDQHDRAPAGGHGAHVCHCVHAHAGLMPRGATGPASLAVAPSAVVGVSQRTPPSAAPEPHLRPPVA